MYLVWYNTDMVVIANINQTPQLLLCVDATCWIMRIYQKINWWMILPDFFFKVFKINLIMPIYYLHRITNQLLISPFYRPLKRAEYRCLRNNAVPRFCKNPQSHPHCTDCTRNIAEPFFFDFKIIISLIPTHNSRIIFLRMLPVVITIFLCNRYQCFLDTGSAGKI